MSIDSGDVVPSFFSYLMISLTISVNHTKDGFIRYSNTLKSFKKLGCASFSFSKLLDVLNPKKHSCEFLHTLFFLRTSTFGAEAERSYFFWRFEPENEGLNGVKRVA